MADELRPAFDEPWQAEAYALVQVLIETGRISSSQWAKAFAAGLREAAGQGKPDSSDTYYATLSETLQRVLVAAGRVQEATIQQRIDDWRAAYRRTPHGNPVRLKKRKTDNAESLPAVIPKRLQAMWPLSVSAMDGGSLWHHPSNGIRFKGETK